MSFDLVDMNMSYTVNILKFYHKIIKNTIQMLHVVVINLKIFQYVICLRTYYLIILFLYLLHYYINLL